MPIERYIIARWAYSMGKPIMTDQEYDYLHRMISLQKDPRALEYLNRTWSDDPCPVELLIKYNLKHLITNVEFYEKGESIESVNEEFKLDSILRDYKEDEFILVSPKINGWSVRIQINKGIVVSVKSRARENNNEMSFDNYISEYQRVIDSNLKDKSFSGLVMGEAFLTHQNFETLKIKEKVTSQVASIITAIKKHPYLITVNIFNIIEDGKEYKNKLDKYERLKELGIPTVNYKMVLKKDLIEYLKTVSKDENNYLTDGIVIDLPDNKIYAIRLFNYKNAIYKSVVTGIEEDFNAVNMSLKLLIEPVVTREGSIQRKLDIDNLSRIQEFGITLGSTVFFEKISDSVANISQLTKEFNKYASNNNDSTINETS